MSVITRATARTATILLVTTMLSLGVSLAGPAAARASEPVTGVASVRVVDGLGRGISDREIAVWAMTRSGSGWHYTYAAADQGDGDFAVTVPQGEEFVLAAQAINGGTRYYLSPDGTTTSLSNAAQWEIPAGAATISTGTLTLWTDRSLVTVNVEDTSGHPVTGSDTWLNAYLYDPVGEQWQQVSDGLEQGDGAWTFRLRFGSAYTIGAHNHLTGGDTFLGGTAAQDDPSTDVFTLTTDQTSYDAGTITLPVPTKLRVDLVDADGDPLTRGSYEVSLLTNNDDGAGPWGEVAAQATIAPEEDGNSSFTFHVDPTVDYLLKVLTTSDDTPAWAFHSDSGLVTATEDATVLRVPSGETTTVASTVPQARSITGHLTDGTDPIAGADVTLYGSDDCEPGTAAADCSGTWVDDARTAEDGSFTLNPQASLAAFASYWVRLDHPRPGRVAAASTVVAAPADGGSADVGTIVETLGGHALIGPLVLPANTDAGPGELEVRLYRWDGSGWTSADSWTGTSSEYGFTGLVPGLTYAVKVSFHDADTGIRYPTSWSGPTGFAPVDQHASGTVAYTGATNPTDGPTVAVREGVDLTGTLVHHDGSPCDGCSGHLLGTGPGGALDPVSVHTSGIGQFGLRVLPGGHYELSATGEDSTSASFGPWAVNAARDLGTLTLPAPRQVTGRLTDGTHPIAGATIALYVANPSGCPPSCPSGQYVTSGTTDADGRFGLSPRSLHGPFVGVWVQVDHPKPGYAPATSNPVLLPEDGSNADVGTIVATVGAHALVGQLTPPAGVSVDSITAQASLYRWSGGAWGLVDSTRTAGTEYGFTDLVPGATYAVALDAQDRDSGVAYPRVWSGANGFKPVDQNAPGSVAYLGTSNPTAGPTLQVRTGATLSGKLLNADGTPCRSCSISASATDVDGQALIAPLEASTGQNGAFAFRVLPGARYALTAYDAHGTATDFGPWQIGATTNLGSLSLHGEPVTPLEAPALSSTHPTIGDTVAVTAAWATGVVPHYTWRWYDPTWTEHTSTGTQLVIPAAAAGRPVSIRVRATSTGMAPYDVTLSTVPVVDPSVAQTSVTVSVTTTGARTGVVAGGYVSAFDEVSGTSASAFTNGAGQAVLVLLQGHTYAITASTADWSHAAHATYLAPDTATGTRAISITVPPPPPGNVSIGGAGVISTGGGTSQPTINWSEATTVTLTGCATTADGQPPTWSMTFVGEPGQTQRTGTFTSATSAGVTTYSATIPALLPAHGQVTVSTNIAPTCGAAPTSFSLYIDPSGAVVDQYGRPISGATVTLSALADADGTSTNGVGTYTEVPDGSEQMSPDNRTNPDTTDDAGTFRWDVTGGAYYKVLASADGCGSASTPPLYVGSPAIDLTIRLTCTDGAHSLSPSATVDYTGSPKVGTLLTARDPWAGAGLGTDYTPTYTWRVKHGTQPATVVGTSATYTPTTADAGGTITLSETVKRDAYRGGNSTPVTFTASASSTSATATVASGTQGTLAQPLKPTGSGKVGSTLTVPATPPTGGAAGTTFTWAWAVGGTTVSGSDNATTYVVTPTAVGRPITVTYTATALGYDAATVNSAGVTGLLGDAPSTTSKPVVQGTPTVGQRLSASAGAWSAAGTATYAWTRNGKPITGATGSGYTVGAGDVGALIAATVSWRRAGYADGIASATGVRIGKAAATVTAKLGAVKAKPKKGVLTVTVTSAKGLPLTGSVTVLDGTTVVAAATVPAKGVVRVALVKVKKKGSHQLTVKFSGNAALLAATSRPPALKIK